MSTHTPNIQIEKSPWVWLFLLFVTILGLMLNGYRYGASDQALYIPMIDRAVNSELFPNDFLFDEPSGEYNFWVPLMATLARYFSLEWIFFLTYALTRFGLFWAIYHLALNLFGDRRAAILAVFFVLVPTRVGGTATATQDTFCTLRSTAMPFAIAFLIPYFRGQLRTASIICGVTFLIHPITAIPLVGLLGLRLVIEGFRNGWQSAAKPLGVFTLCTLPLFIRVFLIDRANPSDLSLFSRSDPEWLEIIRERDSYIFLTNWNQDAFQSIAVPLILLIGILYFRRWRSRRQAGNGPITQGARIRETDRWAFGLIMICLVLFIIGAVFVEWVPLPLVVQLQVLRNFYLLINLSEVYFAWLLIELIGLIGFKIFHTLTKRGQAERFKHVVAGCLVIISCVLALPRLSWIDEGEARDYIHLPGKLPHSDWIDVGEWCQANTPIDTTFFVPTNTSGFRIYSQRSSVGDRKDGAPCVFSERYAKEWRMRMIDLAGYDTLNEAKFKQLAEKYLASFIITRKGHRLGFPVLYQNDAYTVYALN